MNGGMSSCEGTQWPAASREATPCALRYAVRGLGTVKVTCHLASGWVCILHKIQLVTVFTDTGVPSVPCF